VDHRPVVFHDAAPSFITVGLSAELANPTGGLRSGRRLSEWLLPTSPAPKIDGKVGKRRLPGRAFTPGKPRIVAHEGMSTPVNRRHGIQNPLDQRQYVVAVVVEVFRQTCGGVVRAPQAHKPSRHAPTPWHRDSESSPSCGRSIEVSLVGFADVEPLHFLVAQRRHDRFCEDFQRLFS